MLNVIKFLSIFLPILRRKTLRNILWSFIGLAIVTWVTTETHAPEMTYAMIHPSTIHPPTQAVSIAMAQAASPRDRSAQPQTTPPAPHPHTASPTHSESLPIAQAHPLPPTLAAWTDPNQQGDYFSTISATPVGHLVWSKFPIRVYVEPTIAPLTEHSHHSANHSAESGHTASDAAIARSQAWVEAVTEGMQAWAAYLPMELTDQPDQADISIWRTTPALQPLATPAPSTMDDPAPQSQRPSILDRLPRARSAETRYELYVDRSVEPPLLTHRFRITITPNQTAAYTQVTARHEMGHALGLWGHSPTHTDVMYFSQVRHPPSISDRDINTLKRIYEQPTQLGWSVQQ